MRCLLVALGLVTSLIAALPDAFAQEFELPTLGGPPALLAAPPAFTGWGGVYFGGQVGYSSSGVDFSNGVNDLSSFIVRNSIFEAMASNFSVLPKVTANAASYGWFVGYNSQWEGAMLGLEVNYNRTNIGPGASGAETLRIASDASAPPGHHFVYDPFNVSGVAGFRITDFATLRARAGWTVGQFMPYAFLGAAVVRADVFRSATVSYTRTDFPDLTNPPTPPLPTQSFGPVTQTDAKTGAFSYGYAAGLGLDFCLMPNVFVRGEWEFIEVRSMRATINTVRSGIGVKF
jgi:opacity protein-like surface antigen